MVNGKEQATGIKKGFGRYKEVLKKKKLMKGRKVPYLSLENPEFELVVMSRYAPVSMY